MSQHEGDGEIARESALLSFSVPTGTFYVLFGGAGEGRRCKSVSASEERPREARTAERNSAPRASLPPVDRIAR